VRDAVLVLLSEQSRNGYQIMQEIEQRSGGVWRPSPGSVYPALAQLEDEGLVVSQAQGGGKVFGLTDAGRAAVTERGHDRPPPWEAAADTVTDDMVALRSLVGQLGGAVRQVVHAGSPAQVAQAAALLAETRRALYRILAEDDPGDTQP